MKQKKIILITGASSGFGKNAALKLIQQGHIVYGAARSTDKMRDLEEMGGHLLKMDVTDNTTVLAGVERIIEEQGRLDVLINNAGYGTYGMIESVPQEEVQRQYNVNVFGFANVLRAVLPHMRKQRKGRIINTASMVSHISTACLGWYASTKHAVKGISDALRQEVRGLGIDVVMIEPGAVKTKFDEIAFKTLDRINHPEDYTALVKGFRKALQFTYSKSPGPDSTAAAMVKAVNARRPRIVYKTTPDARMMPAMKRMFGSRGFDNMFLFMLDNAEKHLP